MALRWFFGYLLLYVDDMLVAGEKHVSDYEFKTQLNAEFDMKDLAAAK